MRQHCPRYTIVGQKRFTRGYSRAVLKFVMDNQATYILKEIHEGVCGNHLGDKMMVAKVLKDGHFWQTF